MIPLTNAVSCGFTWSSIPRNRGYELKLNGELAGILQRPSVWKSNFEAETSAGRWIFRRSGFWGTGAEILDSVSQQPIASFKAAWANQGLLTFSDGQTFSLQCKGLWHPTWTVRSEDGEEVLSLHTREKTAEVAGGDCMPENRLPLLIMFTLYRILQAEEDAASAAMVAS
jgi:hypothetical protein